MSIFKKSKKEENDPQLVELTDEASPQIKGQTSPMVIGALINGITGVGIWSITQPIAQCGPLMSLIVICVIVTCYGYSAFVETKYLRPHDQTMLDEILVESYPKYKKLILIFTKVSAFLFIFGTDIDLYMYFSLVIKQQIFDRFHTTDGAHDYVYIVIPIVVVMLLGAIRNTKIFVTLSGLSMVGSVLSMICIMAEGGLSVSSADWQCWKDAWHKPLGVGLFSVSQKKGWGAVFSFSGVMAMVCVSQNFAHEPCGQAKKPEHNGRNMVIVYMCVFLMYFIIWICSGPRYACNYNEAPSLYLSAINPMHWWYGIITQWAYGMECFLSLPLFLAVSRQCSCDLYNFKSKKWHYFWHNVVNGILVAIMSALTVKNVSLQLILMVAGLVATLFWMIALPFGMHLMAIHRTKRFKWDVWVCGLLSLIAGSAMIIQFCLPLPSS